MRWSFAVHRGDLLKSATTTVILAMTTTEIFLIALLLIYSLPYLVWRLARTEHFAPLVVIQIVTGILLGPGVFGAWQPELHAQLFSPTVLAALNGIAWWAVTLFVWIAGIELDLVEAWRHRRDSVVTAGLALGVPLLLGCAAALLLLAMGDGWMGPAAQRWQFIAGIGMACAVTALPILILFLDKLQILREALGQRVLRYASMDDIAIWSVLALILLDFERIGRQGVFVLAFALLTPPFRVLMQRLGEADRWQAGLVWLTACALAADWCGLHFMVGAFVAGVVMDRSWFNLERLDLLRHHVLILLMPVYFLSSGLRTGWTLDGLIVLAAAAILLLASVAGKLLGVRLAGRILHWQPGEASLIGWLLQTKALIMIVFANVLLDKHIISTQSFTALLLMAVASTMLTIPVVTPKLRRLAMTVAGTHPEAIRKP